MKKYIVYTFVLFLMLIISFGNINAQNSFPLVGKIIVVDPGHGGVDPGTVFGDIYEKNLNLEISQHLKNILEQYGASVIITRQADYDLSSPNAIYRKKSDFDNRIKLINESKADLYLSIHLNYLTDSSYFGPQVFYNTNEKKLALILQKSLNNVAKSDRNIKLIPSETYMYKRLNVPGLLIECGFLSNASERKKLNSESYQQKISEAITKGVIEYFT
ncbi:MAG: N-acetylmuramoyl-L-alanine amidase CwlD [Firmicutes bacterium]|nr:N-acetylmuramoyl-L-alanine amidase CwlD [Bacillota bacterium]